MRALSHSRLNLTASLFLATRLPKSGTPVSVGALTTILRITSATAGITYTVAGDVDLIRYTKPSSPVIATERDAASLPCSGARAYLASPTSIAGSISASPSNTNCFTR